MVSLNIYRIYPNKSRAHINIWAQINTGVQYSKANKRLYKMWKGLIRMPGQKWSIGNKYERNLLIPYARTDVHKYSFFLHTASLWNKLQETIKETQSLDIFKFRI